MIIIEKYIKDNYQPIICEDKDGMKCIIKHNTNLTEDGVVYFKNFKYKKKTEDNYFIILDDIEDIFSFLENYYNLIPEDKTTVREIIVSIAVDKIKKHFND